MNRFRPYFILSALALALLAQWTLGNARSIDIAVGLFALSIMLIAAALGSLDDMPSVSIMRRAAAQPPVRFMRFIGGLLVSSGLGGMALASIALTGEWARMLDIVALPFVLSLVLTLMGIHLLERPSPHAGHNIAGAHDQSSIIKRNLLSATRHALRTELRSPLSNLHLLGILLLAFALFLRLDRFDYYPPPHSISWSDEAQIGKDAHLILAHGARPWQFPLLTYPTAFAFAWLGESTFALRLVPDLWGFATLVVFFALARELFHAPAAFVATGLFAVSRWHLALTRIPFPVTTSTFLVVAIFWLLARGLRTHGAANFLMAGLLLGIGYYDYAAFKITPIFVAIFLIVRWLRSAANYAQTMPLATQPGAFVRRLFHVEWRIAWGLGMGALGVALALTPFFALAQRDPRNAVTERFMTVLAPLFNRVPLSPDDWLNVRRHGEMLWQFFNLRGEPWGAVNIPYAPMLDPLTGALFVLALGFCILTFWRHDHLTWLMWFGFTLIGGGVFVDIFRSHRFAMAIPTIFLLIGALVNGIHRATQNGYLAAGARARRSAWPWNPSRLQAFVQHAPLWVVIGLLPLATLVNYDQFFNQQIHRADVRIEYDRDIVSVANAIADLPGKPYVYLFADWPFYTVEQDFGWLAGFPQGRRAGALMEALAAADAPAGDVAFVFAPSYDGLALSEVVRAAYPSAKVEQFRGPQRPYAFHVVRVSAQTRAVFNPPTRGLRVSYMDSLQPAQPLAVRTEPALTFTYLSEPMMGLAGMLAGKKVSVQWDGKLLMDESGNYRLKFGAFNGALEGWLDGRNILQEPGRARELVMREVVINNLASGAHAFRLKYTPLSLETTGAFTRYTADVFMRWVGPDGVERALPPGLFISDE